MSSILKALRKIEEEKRVAKHVAPDLCVDQGLLPVKSRQYLPLLAGIVLGAVVVGLFFLMSTEKTDPVVQGGAGAQPATTVAVDVPNKEIPPVTEVKAPAPAVTRNLTQEKFASENKPSVSVKTVWLVEKRVPAKTASAIVHRETASPQSPPKPVVSKEPVVVPAIETVAIGRPNVSSEISTILPEGFSLIVNEIYYQEDGSDSMALVNDLPVMVGTHVESAVVDEIRPKQVLFRISGKLYLVNLASY